MHKLFSGPGRVICLRSVRPGKTEIEFHKLWPAPGPGSGLWRRAISGPPMGLAGWGPRRLATLSNGNGAEVVHGNGVDSDNDNDDVDVDASAGETQNQETFYIGRGRRKGRRLVKADVVRALAVCCFCCCCLSWSCCCWCCFTLSFKCFNQFWFNFMPN